MRLAHGVATVLFLVASGDVAARGARSFKSGTIQVTASGEAVWTANGASGSLTRLGGSGTSELALAGCKPSSLSVSEDGATAWATCPEQDAIVSVSSSGAEGCRIELPWGSSPEGIALSPDGTRALVTLGLRDAVAVVDVERCVIDQMLPTWRHPFAIAWQPDGLAAWINHATTDGEATRITRVSLNGTPHVTAAVRLGYQEPSISSSDPAIGLAEGGAPIVRGQLAMRPRTGELWLPTQLLGIRDPVLSPDTTAQSALHVLDTASGRWLADKRIVLTAVDAHDPVSGALLGEGFDARVSAPVDIGFSVGGDLAWVLHESSNDLVEYPLAAGAWRGSNDGHPLREVHVGDHPTGVALDPRADIAWVHAAFDREIVAVDLDTFEVVARFETTAIAPPSLRGELLEGASLFFRSDLDQICRNDKVACATCHPGGGADGLIWPEQFQAVPLGPRATTTLLGLSLTFGPRDPQTGFGQLHRSGDRDEIQDFDFTFRGDQMRGTGFIPRSESGGYGGPPNDGQSPQMDAMSTFLLQTRQVPRSPERLAGGGYSDAAKRGASIFSGSGGARADAACASCHLPNRKFADLKFHDVGAPRTSDEHEINTRAPEWAVNTPTLVGLFATGPWDRGGIEGTQREHLPDAIADLAQAGGAHGRLGGLTQRQVGDLAAFVGSLDTDAVDGLALGIDNVAPVLVRVEPISPTRVACWFSETVDGASASLPSNWSVTSNGQTIPVNSVEWDALRGDRVTLHVQLPRTCSGQAYIVQPGPILDAAAAVSGRSANALSVGDPANTHAFTLGDTLTITLGTSGAEHLQVPVHDAGMAGPDQPARFVDSPWIKDVGAGSTVGLIRFDWLDAFEEATGVTDPAALVDAAIDLQPAYGAVGSFEARRVLKPWSDAHAGDAGDAPAGAPSWLYCAAPQAWSVPGAGARGGTGNDPADYLGGFDLAASVDAAPQLVGLEQRLELGGPGMTSAYRFFMANPVLDYGHALASADGSELRLERSEDLFGSFAPVLRITYALPPAPRPAPEVSGPLSGQLMRVAREPMLLAISFEDSGASEYSAVNGTFADFTIALQARCLEPMPLGAGRLGASFELTEPAAWFVVAASGACGGELGAGSLGPGAVWTDACTP